MTSNTSPNIEGQRKKISIIVPARNEEEMLPHVKERVTKIMSSLPYEVEIILVDNASTDRTGALGELYCEQDSRWRYLKMSRNFSLEASLAAGMYHADGDAVIFLFSDLQDPPEKIPDLVEKWEQGFEVVYGVRRKRPGDPVWRNLAVRLFYWLINRLTDVRLPENAGDFRLLSRRVVDILNQMDERTRYLRGLTHWVGFESCPVHYDRQPRLAGKSKFPVGAALAFAVNALTSFSIKPIRAFSLFGILIICLAISMALFYVGLYFIRGFPVRGVATTYILLLTNLGVMSLGFGVIGEYISHIVSETKRRPIWIIEKAVNLDTIPKSDLPPTVQTLKQQRDLAIDVT